MYYYSAVEEHQLILKKIINGHFLVKIKSFQFKLPICIVLILLIFAYNRICTCRFACTQNTALFTK